MNVVKFRANETKTSETKTNETKTMQQSGRKNDDR